MSEEYSLNIVLIEPEIPQNTGNIARTCAATGARLHLVKPMGFKIDDKKLKRAGLDYWDKLDITMYENTDEFFEKIRTESSIILRQKAKIHTVMSTMKTTVFSFSEKKQKACPKNF